MACATTKRSVVLREYKDVEKADSLVEADENNVDTSGSNSGSAASSVSRQLGMWPIRARFCWHILLAITVLFALSAVCGRVSLLHSSPPSLYESSSSSSSSSSSKRSISSRQSTAPPLLNVAAIEPLASAGCATEHNVSINETKEIKMGNRTYRLYFPVNYEFNKPAPLILSYHGGHRTAKWQEELDLLTTTYFNKDYIVVYPQGVNETWQGVPGVQTDDIGFTTEILDELESSYCIDTNRIYATGKSQGAGFVGVLACEANLSMRIAAYAPVSGAFYISNYGDTCSPTTVPIKPCNPGRTNIPMLEFHGLADATIAYMGGERKGGCLASIPHWIQTWALRDGLGMTNVSMSVPGASEGSSAVMYEFGTGWQQGLVTHIMDGDNIDHDWPSTQINIDNTAQGHVPATFNASTIILEYFATHPLGWNFES